MDEERRKSLDEKIIDYFSEIDRLNSTVLLYSGFIDFESGNELEKADLRNINLREFYDQVLKLYSMVIRTTELTKFRLENLYEERDKEDYNRLIKKYEKLMMSIDNINKKLEFIINLAINSAIDSVKKAQNG